MTRRSRASCALAAALALAAAAGGAPQAPEAPPETPVFPRDVELVTVDVVVADRRGEPITGLTREDFTVLDEGQPQAILSFDVVAPRAEAAPAAPGTPAAPPVRPRIATNDVPAAAELGRTFVVFFDSLNLSALNAQRAKAAIAAFLDRGARPGDRIMLVSTGGGAWWSTRLPEGREDLLAVLKGLDGRRFKDPAFDRMTDYEALRIYVYKDAQVGRRVQSRWERYGVRWRTESPAQRSSNEIYVPGVVDMFVENRAAETYLRARTRNRETLAALERLLGPLATTRDRKSLLLVSEGFVYDPTEDAFKGVVEAARRANAALYFVDTRGLEGMPSQFSALFGDPIDERDMLSALADTSREGEGSIALARDTGGFSVTDTNDLESGIVRIGRESRSYYLLGYSPSSLARDGRFRRIEVKVKRPGTIVRARRGYYAPTDAPAARKEPAKTDPQIQAALDNPIDLEGIPLRMTAYVLEDVGAGKARVLVAADADVSAVTFEEKEGGRLAAVLDTLVVVARRETAEFHRSDKRVDLERRPDPVAGPAWYTMVREFDVASGVYQARLVVRDATSRAIGTVTLEFEVPPLDRLRVTTPVLTDAVQVTPGGVPNAVLLARRTFRPDRPFFCRFDVLGAATDRPGGMPFVKAGHTLRRRDGVVLSHGEPSEIVPTSIGSVSRLMQIPIDGLDPGEYELLLTVRDERSGETAQILEPFTLAPATGETASR